MSKNTSKYVTCNLFVTSFVTSNYIYYSMVYILEVTKLQNINKCYRWYKYVITFQNIYSCIRIARTLKVCNL